MGILLKLDKLIQREETVDVHELQNKQEWYNIMRKFSITRTI